MITIFQSQSQPPDNVRLISLKTGVKPSPEFAKKHLATHSAHIGLLCSHGCKYCSTAAMVRTHKIFKELGQTSFQAFHNGIAIIGPNIPDTMRRSCLYLSPSAKIFLTTTTDAWGPEAQIYNVGRRCLESILRYSYAKIRILTKNAAITRDYDFIAQHSDRIELSLSITAPPSKAHLARIIHESIEDVPNTHLGKRKWPCLPDQGKVCDLVH